LLAQFILFESQARTVQRIRLPHDWNQCYRLAVEAGIVYRPSLAARVRDRVLEWIAR
jgi:hypothetical protein